MCLLGHGGYRLTQLVKYVKVFRLKQFHQYGNGHRPDIRQHFPLPVPMVPYPPDQASHRREGGKITRRSTRVTFIGDLT